MLACGRDIPDGRLTLVDDRLMVHWPKAGASAGYFDRVRDVSRRVAFELGAAFLTDDVGRVRATALHGLGGCRMGRSDREGVVDIYGRVYGHPGLYISDGSVMPGPVGANPALTITALAERFADAMLEEPSRSSAALRPATPTSPVAAEAESMTPTSLSFTVEMKGYVSFGETDFDRGFKAGQRTGTPLMFHVTITMDDLERFLADPEHAARAEGWIESDAFGGRLALTTGSFNLLADQGSSIDHARWSFRLEFVDDQGHPLTLTGETAANQGGGRDPWSELARLSTRVVEGHSAPAHKVVASGILQIQPLDFARQLTTVRVEPPERIDVLAAFGALFAGDSWSARRPGAGT